MTWIVWPPRNLTTLRQKLDALAGAVDASARQGLAEESSWLAGLLVVRASGYLEQVALEVSRAYVEARSGGYVRNFARSWLDRSQNPTPEALLLLVGRFDAELAKDLEDLLESEDQVLRRELAFLVDRRNRIAHGMNEGIGAQKALQMKDVAVEVGDWFILRLNPQRA